MREERTTPPRPVLVTGSSGFIGTHLMRTFRASSVHATGLDRADPLAACAFPFFRADIREEQEVRGIARSIEPHTIVHLAARCEVTTPWERLGELLETNVQGSFNVLSAFRPRVFVFASSSSVCGNARPPGAAPSFRRIRPLSAYGFSKAMGEQLCKQWVRETGRSAVVLRIGNVIGPGCHGLIRYLVDHARKHSDGAEPAQVRGAGRLLRDYVPAEHVARALSVAATTEWTEGSITTVNVSTGRGLTNREVAETVAGALHRQGLPLRFEWAEEAAPDEAQSAVLDPRFMEERLGVARARPQEVWSAIEQAVTHALHNDLAPVEPG